jgi:hypothetical protein
MKKHFSAAYSYALCSFAVGLASCDDTKEAIKEEATETRQELVNASEQATKQAELEAERKAKEVASEVDASAGQAKKRIREAADTIEHKVDKLDKSVADAIRDENPKAKASQ